MSISSKSISTFNIFKKLYNNTNITARINITFRLVSTNNHNSIENDKNSLSMFTAASSTAPSVHFTLSGRRRFYKYVQVYEVEDGKFGVLLDGKHLKTPAKHSLVLPSLQLTLAIAAEWDNQSGIKGIQPSLMPMMTLVCTALDQTSVDMEYSRHVCLSYLLSDTALYFASEEGEEALLNNQKKYFEPVITWFKNYYDIDLDKSYNSASRLIHDKKSIDKIIDLVARLDPFALTALQSATMELKSIVLALAFIARKISYDEAKLAGRLEEEYQLELWGLVEGGHDMDRLNNSVRLSSVDSFMRMLYSDSSIADLFKSNNILDND